jgi:putative glutamine amidotransferase
MRCVGIVCDLRREDGMANHRVGEEYVDATRSGVGALPLLIPVGDPLLPMNEILARVDGLLFPGSPSNVDPARYGGKGPGTFLDTARDATSLTLIRAAIAADKPLLAICRGFQELNVALRGSLHQQLHDSPGRLDHREDPNAPLAVQYGPAHGVTLAQGGLLAKLTGETAITVNSLHGQGIDCLAPGLVLEATAPDGTIEAVSLRDRRFVLGVQWHPEWHWPENPVSRAIFAGFGDALGL